MRNSSDWVFGDVRVASGRVATILGRTQIENAAHPWRTARGAPERCEVTSGTLSQWWDRRISSTRGKQTGTMTPFGKRASEPTETSPVDRAGTARGVDRASEAGRGRRLRRLRSPLWWMPLRAAGVRDRQRPLLRVCTGRAPGRFARASVELLRRPVRPASPSASLSACVLFEEGISQALAVLLRKANVV